MAEPLIPETLAIYYAIFAMLLVGLIVEKYYVNRATLFINSGALLLHAKQFPEVGISIAIFVLGSIAVGIGSIVSYLIDYSLPDRFYEFCYFTYSSAPVAILMLMTFVFSPTILWLIVALGIGAVVNSWLLTRITKNIAPVEQFVYPARLADELFGTNWR